VLGGAQSVHCCSYDEPVCLPTEESHRLAVRTQQILAFETGAANVADPLGGSYYVEALTDKLEKEAMEILDDVEKNGGIVNCIKSGWMDGKIEEAMYQVQQDIKSGERDVVGVNALTINPDHDTVVAVHRVPKGVAAHQKKRLRNLRKNRDSKQHRKTLRTLFDTAREDKKHNLIPFMMDAVKAGATLCEIMGVLRMAWDMPYDPLGKLNAPSWLRAKAKAFKEV
jgi:methylmalonyl-CoA mutase N-terminal domain/subunit